MNTTGQKQRRRLTGYLRIYARPVVCMRQSMSIRAVFVSEF